MAATADLAERIALLSRFVSEHSDSAELQRAREMLTAARAAHGEALLDAGDTEGGTALIELAFSGSPRPWTDRLLADVIAKLPLALYVRGQRPPAFAMANEIEKELEDRPEKLLPLAGFYLSIENGNYARRIVGKAIAAGDDSADAYVVLGMAERLSFDMPASEKAYAAALERRPDSARIVSSLADVKRAVGKPSEALELYQRLLANDPSIATVRAGAVMSLFESGKTAEGEAELEKAVADDPSNLLLLASAAYWYATQGNGERAAEFGSKAIAVNPRYIWSHIALARGLMLQGKPVDAERVLLAARKYGNFPTISYELALMRAKAGFFRDAGDELKKVFTLDGRSISTHLGGYIEREAATFSELLAGERQASLFAFRGPDDAADAARLVELLAFTEAAGGEEPNVEEAVAAAKAFSAGDDDMKVHRLLYVSARMLESHIEPETAREFALAATGTTDAGLRVADPAAAVMADALYDGRQAAIARDEYLLVPEVARPVLSAVLRGRIEELAGRGHLEKGEHDQAIIRFRRALSVLPKDSLWWRNAKWNLGNSLAAEGNDAEALENYIDGYEVERPDAAKYAVIETLYRKVNDSIDGLEAKIGPNPIPQAPAEPAPMPQEETAKTSDEQPKEPEPEKTETDPPTEPEPEKTEELPKEETKTEEKELPTESEPEKKEEVPAEEKNEEDGEPKQEPLPVKTEEIPVEEKKEEIPAEETEPPEETADEEKAPEKADEEEATPEEPEVDTSGTSRPRLVSDAPVNHINFEPCLITSSQDNISIINNGGNVGIIIGIDGDTEAMKITSSSPQDVEMKEQSRLAGASKRIFYIVRSISTVTGDFTIDIQAPCGKKQINVRVR